MKTSKLFLSLLISVWVFIGATCAFFETKYQIEDDLRKDITYDPMLR